MSKKQFVKLPEVQEDVLDSVVPHFDGKEHGDIDTLDEGIKKVVVLNPTLFYAKDTDVLNQTSVVQNTWYTAVDLTGGHRLQVVAVLQDNTENAAKDIEVRVTMDGEPFVCQTSMDDNTINFIFRYYYGHSASLGLWRSTAWQNFGYYTFMECHELKVEIRTTSVPGTAQALKVYVVRESLS